MKSLSSGLFPDIDSEFWTRAIARFVARLAGFHTAAELRGSSNSSHVRVRYRTDKSIKIVYKWRVDNCRPSLRAVIGYG
jgi:hypothetical protein